MPVKINPSCALPALARHIHDRTKLMIDRGWNDNFERFLGSSRDATICSPRFTRGGSRRRLSACRGRVGTGGWGVTMDSATRLFRSVAGDPHIGAH